MAYKSIYNDIIFIEGEDNRVKVKGNVSYNYGSIGSQLRSLKEVKKSLALQAKSRGCNCIVEFKYGQKASWFSLDDTKWYGNGKCGILADDDYNKIINEEIKN